MYNVFVFCGGKCGGTVGVAYFYFLFTKICVSKNPSLQTPGTLDILATLQWQVLKRHWTPNEPIDSSNFLFLFNFLLLHL